jgi:predicted enzyme related to lactoylglutathione lyase
MSAKMFRLILQVGDLERAAKFYGELLGTPGRPVGGGRIYFDTGAMILAILQPEGKPRAIAEYLYFAVDDVDAFHGRAQKLKALADEDIHGSPARDVVRRPWGERSFYAVDPWGNGLCFVDEATLFTGRR